MSLLRRDPVSYGWTIFPEEDYPMPQAACADVIDLAPEQCPFCPGHEEWTPPEIAAIRPPDSKPNRPGWRVRTIPDRKAVLRIEGKLDRRGEGLYDMMNGIGAHEIIIESPDHHARFSDFSRAQLAEIVWMYRERQRDLLQDKRFRYIQLCRNYGARAGARLPHPHSLCIALPVVPRWVREELARASEYWQMKERCVFCDIVAQEQSGERLVYENADFCVIEPFAARVPYETWVFPREHRARFHEMGDDQIATLADALRRVSLALERRFGNPAYNLIFHSAPTTSPRHLADGKMQMADYYHWHIEIVPRMHEVSGFEYGTGIYINPLLPERAAAQLREEFAKIEEQLTSGDIH